MTLSARLLQLTAELRATAQDIRYHRPHCRASCDFADFMLRTAYETEEFALAVDVEDQESTRH